MFIDVFLCCAFLYSVFCIAGLLVWGGVPHQLGGRPDSQLVLHRFFAQFVCTVFVHGWIDGLWRVSAPVGGTTRFAIISAHVFCTVFVCTVFLLLHGWIDGLRRFSAPVGGTPDS